jgi:hypothetical protein
MEQQGAKFEGWAVIELFGHNKEAGLVTTEYFGDRAMFRIDIPELPEREIVLKREEYLEVQGKYRMVPKGSKVQRQAVAARTRLVNPGAVYALNPCTEDAARRVIEELVPRKLAIVELAQDKQLTAGTSQQEEADLEDYADDVEDDVEIPI